MGWRTEKGSLFDCKLVESWRIAECKESGHLEKGTKKTSLALKKNIVMLEGLSFLFILLYLFMYVLRLANQLSSIHIVDEDGRTGVS